MEEPDQPDGTESWRDAEGRLHREDGPAWACWLTHPNGVRYTEEKWYRHGVLHRMGAPARIKTCRGEICAASWWTDGRLHREDGPAKTGEYGDYWFRHGKLHRDEGPAKQFGDIYYAWYKDGKLHRDDGPARVRYGRPNELIEESWWQRGRLHRLDGPAKITPDRQQWYQRGKLHREDGPAVIITSPQLAKKCIARWFIRGQLHRTDGPAVEYPNGSKEYWLNGKLHRSDGPAVVVATGLMIRHPQDVRFSAHAHEVAISPPQARQVAHTADEFWIVGWQLSEEDFLLRQKKKRQNRLRSKRPE